MRLAALGAAAVATGCAFGDGDYFARVDARLDAAFDVPADRDLGDGWQKLASNYEIRLDAATMSIDEIALVDTGGGAAEFDPANPPPGFSLCHNGHCHADDGRLVDYEDVAAEAAGAGGATVALSFPVGSVDLLAGDDRALACAPESCGVAAPASITLARTNLGRVRLAGIVRDGQTPPRIDGETAFVFDITFGDDPPQINGELDLPADRGHDPDVTLTAAVRPSARLLDPVDFAALAGDDPIALSDDPETRNRVLARILDVSLEITIER